MANLPLPSDTLSLAIVVIIACSIPYRISFFKDKRLFRLSLLQILYLVILPGTLYLIALSYIQKIADSPRYEQSILPDRLIINSIYLAMFYTYGGTAIHAATKTLSDTKLRHDDSEVGRLNRHLHLTVSHNLIFGGAIVAVAGMAILELNHIPAYEYNRWLSPLVRGISLGLAFIYTMFNYTRSNDEYTGRWADLKAVFVCAALATVLISYVITKADPTFRQYQLLLPSLIALAFVNSIPVLLIIRRAKHHKWLSRLIDPYAKN